MAITMTNKIGILGDGQLAMMLSQAAQILNIETLCFGRANSPASYASNIFEGNINNISDLKKFTSLVDTLTFETENINCSNLRQLKQNLFAPHLTALEIFQDRSLEKKFINNLDISVAPYYAISSLSELYMRAEEFHFNCILKVTTSGYDGKGQYKINSESDLKKITADLLNLKAVNYILEKKIDFNYEVSIIAVANKSNTLFYPLVKNTHRNGILIKSEAPIGNSDLQNKAEHIVSKIISKLNYIGVICVEFFIYNNQLIVNEVAPRVHNSGHWTIEGARTSQFENHLRAIAGLELGDTTPIGVSKMYNFIGEIPLFCRDNVNPAVHIHSYHKATRPNRKLGHMTIVSENLTKLNQISESMESYFS